MAIARVQVKLNPDAFAELRASPQCQKALDEIAKAVLARQKTLVPVDTGHLSRSLKIRNTADSLGREVGSFDVDYALPVETGHQTESGTFVPAQPFIRPSVDAAKVKIRRLG